MRQALRWAAIGFAPLLLGGCLARTVVSAATLPVKVASRGVDIATTSQSEADQKRGREIRQREERMGELQRDYDKQAGRCENGDREACGKAAATEAEMRRIMPSLPVEPESD